MSASLEMVTKRSSSTESPKFSVFSVLKEMDKRYEQRFGEQEKRYEERFEAQEKAVAAALASAKEAVSKAENASEKRFVALNELRQVVNDILNKNMSRTEADTNFNSLREKISEMALRIESLDKKIVVHEGEGLGRKDTQSVFRSNVAMVVSLGLFILTVIMWLSRIALPK